MATLSKIRDTQVIGQDEYLKNQHAMAQKNYQGAVQSFQGAYDRTKQTVDSEQSAFKQSLENQYQMAQTEMSGQKGQVQEQAREMAKQAYIGKRMTEKAMPNQMEKLGLGQTGYAESSAIKNEVGYQNAVNQTNKQMAQQLSAIDMELQKLAMKRDDQLTQAEIRYRQELVNAKSALEQNIATAGVNRDTTMLSAQGQRDLNVSNIQSTYQENVYNQAQAQASASNKAQTDAVNKESASLEKASKDLAKKIDASILGKALTQSEINQMITLEVGKLSALSTEQKNQLIAEMRKRYTSQVSQKDYSQITQQLAQNKYEIY